MPPHTSAAGLKTASFAQNGPEIPFKMQSGHERPPAHYNPHPVGLGHVVHKGVTGGVGGAMSSKGPIDTSSGTTQAFARKPLKGLKGLVGGLWRRHGMGRGVPIPLTKHHVGRGYRQISFQLSYSK